MSLIASREDLDTMITHVIDFFVTEFDSDIEKVESFVKYNMGRREEDLEYFYKTYIGDIL